MVTASAAKRLRKILHEHKDSITVPRRGAWKAMSDNQLWSAIVLQVVVVGSSKPHGAVRERLAGLGNWYRELITLPERRRRSEIHQLLRSAGVRYISKRAADCRKTNALVKNLALIQSVGGPKAYISSIAVIAGESKRIWVVGHDMSYIKKKGARDLLIDLGIIRNAIAFDVRVRSVLESCGIDIPENLGSSEETYRQLESELIDKVCRPARVPGCVLDRILYQKYREIV